MNVMRVADLGLGHIRLDTNSGQGFQSLGVEYGPAGGYPAVREAIARWERVSSEEIAVTTGASMALVATLATLKRPCSILCPRPYYPPYPAVAAMLGLDVVFYELERDRAWQPSAAAISKCLRPDTQAILWNFPGNPTGSVPAPEVVDEVRGVVHRHDLLVLSDEVYADFVYAGAELPDARRVFGRERVVRVRSFSKALGIPGERLGYVVAAPERVAAIARAHWTLAMCPPATSQTLGLRALGEGVEERVRHLKETLAAHRNRAARILADCAEIRFAVPAAGIFFWIEVPDCPVDSRTLAQICATQAGVVVTPGIAFGQDAPVYLRASFGVPEDEAVRGFEALGRVLSNLTCNAPPHPWKIR